MHEELEAALRELEAKLPDLRHLIADSGVVLTTSPAALVLAARLLRTITAADEVASLLRLTLLNSGELVDPTAQPAQPVPTAPIPPAPSPPEPPALNPAEIVATGTGLTDSDYALQEALGLIPTTTTSFDQSIAEKEATTEEVKKSAKSFVDDFSDETLDAMKPVMETEEGIAERQALEKQSEELRIQITAALDTEDLDRVRELTAERKELEKRLARLIPLSNVYENQVRGLTEKLNLKSERPESTQVTHEELQSTFRLWGHRYLESFEEAWEEYNLPLKHAMRLYLKSESEAQTVLEGTLAHSKRVWETAEGEMSFLELISSLAVQQIERLLPRPIHEEERYIPNSKQIFRYLARHRVERLIEDIEKRLDQLGLSIQESIREVPNSVHQEFATLEKLRDEVMRQFYNSLLRLDDEDTGEGDAMGARITPPPPMRGPDATRTFDEALALARNP